MCVMRVVLSTGNLGSVCLHTPACLYPGPPFSLTLATRVNISKLPSVTAPPRERTVWMDSTTLKGDVPAAGEERANLITGVKLKSGAREKTTHPWKHNN